MTSPREKAVDKWFNPQTVGIAIAMFGSIAAAWMSFENRVSKVESDYQSAAARFEVTQHRLDRIENKLDRLIERPGSDAR